MQRKVLDDIIQFYNGNSAESSSPVKAELKVFYDIAKQQFGLKRKSETNIQELATCFVQNDHLRFLKFEADTEEVFLQDYTFVHYLCLLLRPQMP